MSGPPDAWNASLPVMRRIRCGDDIALYRLIEVGVVDGNVLIRKSNRVLSRDVVVVSGRKDHLAIVELSIIQTIQQ